MGRRVAGSGADRAPDGRGPRGRRSGTPTQPPGERLAGALAAGGPPAAAAVDAGARPQESSTRDGWAQAGWPDDPLPEGGWPEGGWPQDGVPAATAWVPTGDGGGEDSPVGTRRALRETFETAVPAEVRRARWSVPWQAAVAAVVLAAVVAVLLAVRTADAVPVEQVPDRVTAGGETAGSAAGSAPGPAPGSAPGSPSGSASGSASGAPTAAPLVVASDSADRVAGGGPGAAATEVVVHVVGQVAAPGVVRVPAGARVADALAAAGGATAEADLSRVNLARVVQDGEQVVVLRPGEVLPPAAAGGPLTPGSDAAVAPGAAGGASGPAAPVDLNTADATALDGLPGIGEVLAGRILAWRQERGPFTSVEELGEVSGIGDALMADLRPLVTV